MAYVEPIKSRKHLRYAEEYLKMNHDPTFTLIWKIGLETGLRISDILSMKYSDINYSMGRCEIIESKGTLARKTKAKHKVLKKIKDELFLHYQGKPKKMTALYITPYQYVNNLAPLTWQPMIDARIKQAQDSVSPVIRRVYLSKETVTILKKRENKYQYLHCDDIFNRRTLLSNRAKNKEGRLTRQACWHVFSKLTLVLKEIGVNVKVGCHSLRKSFARHLYFSTGKDISMLMTTIGHQSERISLKYIGLSGDETEVAQKGLIRYFSMNFQSGEFDHVNEP
ncbi:tyrosine-type recombinase/integrase [Aliivibrio logei]|uniref:tyrosine-type recombinase/integrase n=1 Tax=Aliivibrio logei TaxID=688 RepID=UPI0003A0AEE6|nr:tyrosine-type recombinase/integrase [Aliivibrio logei]